MLLNVAQRTTSSVGTFQRKTINVLMNNRFSDSQVCSPSLTISS